MPHSPLGSCFVIPIWPSGRLKVDTVAVHCVSNTQKLHSAWLACNLNLPSLLGSALIWTEIGRCMLHL